jgi:hypothetical protein
MRIYIASSWKNQHAVEMLTAMLRERGHDVLSFVERSYGEGYANDQPMDFEAWMKSDRARKAFEYDSHSAMTCDLLVYIGPSGKDAAAECGMCYGQRLSGRTIPMLALYAKGEDFGLMRQIFDGWYERYTDILTAIEIIAKNQKTNEHP